VLRNTSEVSQGIKKKVNKKYGKKKRTRQFYITLNQQLRVNTVQKTQDEWVFHVATAIITYITQGWYPRTSKYFLYADINYS
jgi:hypothetical protein